MCFCECVYNTKWKIVESHMNPKEDYSIKLWYTIMQTDWTIELLKYFFLEIIRINRKLK